jgi:hypothetical protein
MKVTTLGIDVAKNISHLPHIVGMIFLNTVHCTTSHLVNLQLTMPK